MPFPAEPELLAAPEGAGRREEAAMDPETTPPAPLEGEELGMAVAEGFPAGEPLLLCFPADGVVDSEAVCSTEGALCDALSPGVGRARTDAESMKVRMIKFM